MKEDICKVCGGHIYKGDVSLKKCSICSVYSLSSEKFAKRIRDELYEDKISVIKDPIEDAT